MRSFNYLNDADRRLVEERYGAEGKGDANARLKGPASTPVRDAHKATPRPPVFTPTPFVYRDPATIPPRQFLYGRHLIRGFMSATVAPGGVGKSSLALVEGVAMASGRNLIGVQPPRTLKVWYINLEDPRVEIERRVAAICLHFGTRPSEIEGRLF